MDYKKAYSSLIEGNGLYTAKRINWPSDKVVHWDSLNSDLFIRIDGKWSKYIPSLNDANAEDWIVVQHSLVD